MSDDYYNYYDSAAYIFSNRYFSSAFALSLLDVIGLVVLLVLSFVLCQPWYAAGRTKPTGFGFRWALALALFSALMGFTSLLVTAFVDYAYAGEMQIPGIFGLTAWGVEKAVLIYTVIRVALYPLREAGTVRRDRGAALGLAGAFAGVTGVLFVIQWTIAGQTIAAEHAVYPTYYYDNPRAVYGLFVTTFLANGLYLVYGGIALGVACYARARSATHDIHPALRRAITLMIAVGALWTAHGIATVVVSALGVYGNGVQIRLPEAVAVLNALTLIRDVATYALLVACFRRTTKTAPEALPQ